MSTSNGFHGPKRQGINITVDEKDFIFEFKLDPREYFYPLLLVSPDHAEDYAFWEEEGMSKEKYEHQIKINKMLLDKKYEELFKKKFTKNLEDFLFQLQYEASIQYEDRESLEQKVSKNEDVIFELIKKRGPNIFRHNVVLDKFQDWCSEGDFEKIERIAKALKAFRKNIFGSIPYSYIENKYLIAFCYPFILIKIREIKKEITIKIRAIEKEIKKKKKIYDKTGKISKKITKKERDQRISEEIIDEWRIKQKEGVGGLIRWFDILLELAKKEEEKTGKDFVSFIKENSPRHLLRLIFGKFIHKSPPTIAKIIRDREKILEMVSKLRVNVGHVL